MYKNMVVTESSRILIFAVDVITDGKYQAVRRLVLVNGRPATFEENSAL